MLAGSARALLPRVGEGVAGPLDSIETSAIVEGRVSGPGKLHVPGCGNTAETVPLCPDTMRKRSPGIGPVPRACGHGEALTGVAQLDGQRFAGHTRLVGVDISERERGVLSLLVAMVKIRLGGLEGAFGHVAVRQ